MDTSNTSNTSKTLKTSRKRKLDDTEEGENKPYIKKPLNAFMIFRAEQRQKVWKMLSGQEKAPYFEQAEREKAAHKAMYLGWSAKDNLVRGKKARRSGADYITDLVQNSLPSQTFDCQPYPVQDVNNETLQGLPVQSNYSKAVPLQTISAQTINNYSLPIQTSRKDTDKPYIKKPPNAFMLFMAEQRQRVMQALNIKNSAQVNVEIGQRWKMLSELEKAPYFEQADRVKRAHEAKYPGWSPKDNLVSSSILQHRTEAFERNEPGETDSNTNPSTNESINQAVPVQIFYYEVPPVQYIQNQTFPGQDLQHQALYNPAIQSQAVSVQHLNQALYVPTIQSQAVSVQHHQNQALHVPATESQAVSVQHLQNQALHVPATESQAVSFQHLQNQALHVPATENQAVSIQYLQNQALYVQHLLNQALCIPA
ncbi:hypothetical protein WMY93_018975 [Mugilogobius chulae]|uniref:HMG box domain-containing protein n=1 Tax=Mugilogobius chulae TaxID=88201 RepID=A0AAW0NX49_9GOBI